MLIDRMGRGFKYLRLSVTDFCNFKCTYCLPDGYIKDPCRAEPLDLQEVQNLLCGFARLGFEKVRFTGGEPTTRPDLVTMIESARDTGEFRKIALTTNGFKLQSMLALLKGAGLTHLNVSIDSLDEGRFAAHTGRNLLKPIRSAVEDALGWGFERVKINAVLLREDPIRELDLFLDWIRDLPLSVRFIELMQTKGRGQYFKANHVSAEVLISHLVSRGFTERPRGPLDGPAKEFAHPDYRGTVGLIAPYSKDFCTTCNRLRVTSQGELRLCLFGNENHSLRDLLRSPDQKEELCQRVVELLGLKEEGHRLHQGDAGNAWSLSSMGG